ncbi:interleukin 17a/f3 [Syngnathus typhle]|uniref:interleukin 17a/f3 n=1 Tax=Syngnathus typhle TaxID=161592 RepID=UPI002A6AD1A4|nr:interleukin 17a/f3 [Syngnathus typhle]
MLVLRVVLFLSLATALHATDGGPPNKVRVGRKGGHKRRTVKLVVENFLHESGDLMVADSVPNFANISLSPWTYKESLVPSRLPRVLSDARCLTSACLNQDSGEEDATLEVKPIKYQVLVLHRVSNQRSNSNLTKKKKKKMKFRLEIQTITVGCTCVRRTV